MKIPEREYSTIRAIDDSMNPGRPRLHFGISSSGHACDRWLWLQFRWAVIQRFPGRMLRLFRRGQMEEDIAVQDLRRAGVDLMFTGDNQQFISFGSHVGGSPDGLILAGLIEAPKKAHVWECKTHNDKSYKDLERNGVQKSKPMHYNQMQCYMYGHGLEMVNGELVYNPKKAVHDAFYYAVNKNDDSIHTERIKLDEIHALKNITKSRRIATADRMPPPLSDRSDWYECKMCPAHDFCFGSHCITEVNCRTCLHSTAEPDGTWSCTKWGTIPHDVDIQLAGCEYHILHPDLVPWKFEQCDKWNVYYDGEKCGPNGMSSNEKLFGAAGRVMDVFGGEMINE